MRETLTPPEVARCCRVSAGMVFRWMRRRVIDSHKLPLSRHNRIRRGDLLVFMRKHQMPMDWIRGVEQGYPV